MAVTEAEKQAALADPAIVSRYYEDRLAALGSPEAAMQAVIDAQQEYDFDDSFVMANLPQNVQSLYTQQVQAKSAAAEAGLPYLDLTPAAAPQQTSPQNVQSLAAEAGLPYFDLTAPVDTGVQAPVATSEGITDASIFDYLTQNPNLTDAQLAADMDKYGVSVEQMARATGMNVADIQARYNAATSGLPYLANDNTGAGMSTDTGTSTGAGMSTGTGTEQRKQAILDYLTQNPNATDAQIVAQMDAAGYTPSEVAAATGANLADVQARYEAAKSGLPYFDLTNTPADTGTGGTGDILVPPGADGTGLPPSVESSRSQAITDYLTQNPNLTDAEIAAQMDSAGYTPEEVAAATGTNVADIQARYDAATNATAPVNERSQAITDWLTQNPNATDAEIAAQMDAAGYTPEEVAAATGVSLADIQARYDAVTGGTGGTTDTTGTGGTGGGIPDTGTFFGDGIIGSRPTAEMLTPFQQAALAQNQALLGTMEASAGQFGRLATTDYNRYMNPYTTGVINTTMQDLERQRRMQQNVIGYQATQAGAFGGSRHGVAEALTNEAMQRTMANTAAQQRQAGFEQAQGAAQQDISNEMTQRQFGLSAANQMSNLAERSFNAGTSINNMLNQAGTQQQLLNQAQMDAAAQQAGAYQTYPSTGAGTFAQILGSAPYGQTSTYNPGVLDYLTLGATAYGVSDIRLKKNIKKVGELANGLGVYTWEWKEKVKDLVGNFSMTKGVMAQEAMKVIPEAVKTAPNGYLAVDYSHPELSGVA